MTVVSHHGYHSIGVPFLPPELCRGWKGLPGVGRELPLPKVCGEGLCEGCCVRKGQCVKEDVREDI